MRFLLLSQAALTVLLGALIAYGFGSIQASSFAAGALVILLNLSFLTFAWPRLLAKKQIAPSGAISVIKYAILGWILYSVTQSQTVRVEWFALGLATVVLTVVATAFWESA